MIYLMRKPPKVNLYLHFVNQTVVMLVQMCSVHSSKMMGCLATLIRARVVERASCVTVEVEDI